MGEYRYELVRDWGEPTGRARVVWVMLNPSTADARADDATIRCCTAFSLRWGASGLSVVNLYALRSTDPRGLWRHPDPVGPENDRRIGDHLRAAAARGWPVVCAWGASPRPDREEAVLDAVRAAGVTALALGLTRHGHPRHPLYLPGSSAPKPYLLERSP